MNKVKLCRDLGDRIRTPVFSPNLRTDRKGKLDSFRFLSRALAQNNFDGEIVLGEGKRQDYLAGFSRRKATSDAFNNTKYYIISK